MRIPRARYAAPLICVALLAAFVLAAPLVARHSLIKLVDDQLGVAMDIEDVELDLLDGEVHIYKLQVSGDSGSHLRGTQLYADIDVSALFLGELAVESVRLDGIALRIVRSASGETVVVVPVGTEGPEGANENLHWPLFELRELKVVDAQVDIELPPLAGRLRVEEASLSMLTTLQQDSALLKLTGDWNGSPLIIGGRLSPFEALPWFEGELAVQRADPGELDPYLPEPFAGLGGTVDMRFQGRISSADLAIESELRWQDPRLGIDKLETYGQTLSWQGTLQASGYPDSPSYEISGKWSGTGIGLADRTSGVTLIELSELVAAGFSVDDSGALVLAELDIDAIRAVDTGSEEEQLLQGRNLKLRDLEYSGNSLSVGSIAGQDMVSNLYFSADRGLVAQGVLTASLETLRTSADDGEHHQPLQWRLQDMTVVNSRLTVVDQQFDPPFKLALSVEELQLGLLDSSRPDQPAALNLKATVGEFGRIETSGQISALAPESHTELKGSIKSLALPDLSPYSEYLLGYEMVAGQYDHVFELTIKDSHITASNELELRRARVKKLKDAEPAAPLPMPLDTALDVLRDKRDDIVLSVPLEGQLDDPDIGLDQVVSRALGKALRGGSTAFLKFVLQPYGAIWTGVELGMKQAGKVRLDPMTFAPGSAELGAAQLDYAAKLGKLLSDRPGIELQLCGIAGRDDYLAIAASAAGSGAKAVSADTQDALSPEQRRLMLELAERRSGALKRWLIAEQAVAPERLYPCKPVADIESKVAGIRLSI